MQLGFIVNPIAGMGGKVGLKGTDDILEVAIAKGAKPVSPQRAVEFLQKLMENMVPGEIEVVTCPGIMGEEEAKTARFHAQVLSMPIADRTCAQDTKNAVDLLVKMKVGLIVFVGGDGTARDIYDAMRETDTTPVLGVPAGVKMYSGVFAVSPTDAAEVVLSFAEGKLKTAELEVMDADEEAIRSNAFEIKLYGYLEGPFAQAYMQGSKQLSPETSDEKDNQIAVARFIVEEMTQNGTYILGPGTTVKCIADLLGIKKTLLGVDIYRRGKVILDVDEKKILRTIRDWKKAWIIISPIGRQGILFGRGNQQISPQVIRLVDRAHIIVAATKSKLQSVDGHILKVDTGEDDVDRQLKGYVKVATDYREWRLVLLQ